MSLSESAADLLDAFPSIVELPIAWGQMDAFGHLNNTVYFRFFEDGRMAYFEQIGVLEHMKAHQEGPILAHTECRFRRPLHWPETVSVGTRIQEIGSDRFTMAYRIVSHRLGEVAAEGSGRVVWYDYAGSTKCLLPASILQRINTFDPGSAASV